MSILATVVVHVVQSIQCVCMCVQTMTYISFDQDIWHAVSPDPKCSRSQVNIRGHRMKNVFHSAASTVDYKLIVKLRNQRCCSS